MPVGELARLRQIHVRQEDREAIARQAAGEAVGAHQRAADRAATARDHAIAVGEAGQIVDEVQAIDVAVQHGHHGVRPARCAARYSTRVLNPSHDSRPVSESRSCVALRASRRAKRPRRRTVNSSKLGSSGRLKMMRAPAGPPRAISGTATSLQAICAAARVLEFVGGDRLAGVDGSGARVRHRRSTVAGARTRRRLRSGSTRRANPRAGIWRSRRCSPDAGIPHAKHFPCSVRAPRPNSSDFVSADFTGSLRCLVLFLLTLAPSED